MPSKSQADLLEDILHSARAIEDFVSGMNFSQYETDLKTQSAVERQFLIIAEAAKRLGAHADQLCLSQNWRGIQNFANIHSVHDYRRVIQELV